MEQASGAKPAEGKVAVNMKLPESFHRRLKIASAMTGVNMGELVDRLIGPLLDDILRDGAKALPQPVVKQEGA